MYFVSMPEGSSSILSNRSRPKGFVNASTMLSVLEFNCKETIACLTACSTKWYLASIHFVAEGSPTSLNFPLVSCRD